MQKDENYTFIWLKYLDLFHSLKDRNVPETLCKGIADFLITNDSLFDSYDVNLVGTYISSEPLFEICLYFNDSLVIKFVDPFMNAYFIVESPVKLNSYSVVPCKYNIHYPIDEYILEQV